jgi:hypothetical protein
MVSLVDSICAGHVQKQTRAEGELAHPFYSSKSGCGHSDGHSSKSLSVPTVCQCLHPKHTVTLSLWKLERSVYMNHKLGEKLGSCQDGSVMREIDYVISIAAGAPSSLFNTSPTVGTSRVIFAIVIASPQRSGTIHPYLHLRILWLLQVHIYMRQFHWLTVTFIRLWWLPDKWLFCCFIARIIIIITIIIFIWRCFPNWN